MLLQFTIKYVREILIVLLLISFGISIYTNQTVALKKTLKNTIDSYENQIEKIEELNEKEKKKLLKEKEKYIEDIKNLEKEYFKKEKELTIKKEKKIKERIIKRKERPEDLTKEIEDAFGFTYIP